MAYHKVTPSTETRCPSCTDEGKLCCAGCKGVKYCSLECQQSDWPSHRSLCKSLPSFSHRPSPELRRVIYFPPESKKPEFRWLPICNPPDRAGEQSVQSLSLLNGGHPERHYIQQNSLLNCDLSGHHQINLVFDDHFTAKYSRPNASIRALTGSEEWRGPVVAYCGNYDPSGLFFFLMSEVKDMGLRDLSDLVAFFISYGGSEAKMRGLKGGKVSCLRVGVGEKVEEVRVPRLHPVFGGRGTGAVCGISKLIDMPLLLWQYPDKTSQTSNEIITRMQLNVDPHDENFGLSTPWTGNTLIARADRKPLSEDILLAFADYCAHTVQPTLECQSQRKRQAAVGGINPMRWGEWLKGRLERHQYGPHECDRLSSGSESSESPS